MRVAIVGAGGQLGSELVGLFGRDAIAFTKQDLDVTMGDMVRAKLSSTPMNAIIHCASFTQVDAAELASDKCRRVNLSSLDAILSVCRERDCALIYVSTNYVFGGERRNGPPYREHDQPDPQCVYGETKYLAEQLIARSWPKHIIVRTCGLYNHPSRRSRNFVNAMLRLQRDTAPVWVVNDQHCTPTYTLDAARAIAYLLRSCHYGTYHVTNTGHTTWYNFAAEVFRLRGQEVPIAPVSTDASGALARRPLYSVLDTTKYESLGGPPLRSWKEALHACLNGDEEPYCRAWNGN